MRNRDAVTSPLFDRDKRMCTFVRQNRGHFMSINFAGVAICFDKKFKIRPL